MFTLLLAELFSLPLPTNPQASRLRGDRAACPQSRHGMRVLGVGLLAALWNASDTQWGFSLFSFLLFFFFLF